MIAIARYYFNYVEGKKILVSENQHPTGNKSELSEVVVTVIAIVGFALFIVGCWGLWQLSALFFRGVNNGSFWAQTVAVALFAMFTAVLTFYVTSIVFQRQIEKNRFLAYLEVYKLVINEFQISGECVPILIEDEDFKLLTKYLTPQDYFDFMKLVNVVGVIDNKEIENGKLPIDAHKQLQTIRRNLEKYNILVG